ncbi:transcription elongation factor 1 homolog [Brienomyrus brachyistius]|uniref:transcription elongation factor 1 homolog n=1 Tax=Brienomyrus brachyistius TaxID=42636 RepID=UPI0020B21CEA|nr:transcription elongation factor 1 homolog [Brienomyrus brachyistius]
MRIETSTSIKLQKRKNGEQSLQEVKLASWLFLEKIIQKMGRRKSKRKPPPKKRMTGNLDTQFTCPFCNHEKSCDVKMERSRNTGIISCTVCLEEFQTPITYLSEPVDVYSDWIDACEAANQ